MRAWMTRNVCGRLIQVPTWSWLAPCAFNFTSSTLVGIVRLRNLVPTIVATTTIVRRRFVMAMTATDFTGPAPAATVGRLAANLQARNFDVVVVQTGAEAKAEVLKRIPAGTKILSGKSKKLGDIC